MVGKAAVTLAKSLLVPHRKLGVNLAPTCAWPSQKVNRPLPFESHTRLACVVPAQGQKEQGSLAETEKGAGETKTTV